MVVFVILNLTRKSVFNALKLKTVLTLVFLKLIAKIILVPVVEWAWMVLGSPHLIALTEQEVFANQTEPVSAFHFQKKQLNGVRLSTYGNQIHPPKNYALHFLTIRMTSQHVLILMHLPL